MMCGLFSCLNVVGIRCNVMLCGLSNLSVDVVGIRRDVMLCR